MSETVTLSKEDLNRLIAQAAAGGTPAAQLASPAPVDPEPEHTLADTLRALVHYGRLPDENLARKCLASIDKAYPTEDTSSGDASKESGASE